jgi:hypothetical protein
MPSASVPHQDRRHHRRLALAADREQKIGAQLVEHFLVARCWL